MPKTLNGQNDLRIDRRKPYLIAYALNLIFIVIGIVTQFNEFGSVSAAITILALVELGNLHSGHRKFLWMYDFIKRISAWLSSGKKKLPFPF